MEECKGRPNLKASPRKKKLVISKYNLLSAKRPSEEGKGEWGGAPHVEKKEIAWFICSSDIFWEFVSRVAFRREHAMHTE